MRVALSCIGSLLLIACADIDRLAPGECGNGVVEAGEDCDVYPAHAGADLSCGTDAARACRYVCDPAAAAPACPDGWACGDDGVCAYAAGAFSSGAEVALEADEWEAHDVDGDGATDLTGYRKNAVVIQFGDGNGGFPGAYELETPDIIGRVAFDDVDRDGGADAIVPIVSGLYLLRGAAQAFEPVPTLFHLTSDGTGGSLGDNTRFAMAQFDIIYFVMDFAIDVVTTDDVTFIEIAEVQVPEGGQIPLPERHPIENLLPMPAADIDVDGELRAEEIAVAFTGAGTVWIYGQISALPARIGLRAEVPLPGMIIDKGAAFADVDGDGNMDLLVSVDDDRVAVARGDGAGGFGPAAIDDRFDDLLTIYNPGGGVDGWYTTFQRWPLLAADLDGDGVADYVSHNGFYMTDPATERLQQTQWRYYVQSDWTRVISGDFNGDGRLDVAALGDPDEDERGVDVFFWSDDLGEFTNVFISTFDTPELIGAADFDADFIDDIAVIQRDAFGGQDSLWVLYGNQHAGLSAPIQMGEFYDVFAMFTGLLLESDIVAGFHDDLFLRIDTGRDDPASRTSALVRGSPVRRLVAPYAFRDERTFFRVQATAAATGRFRSEHTQLDVAAIAAENPRGMEKPVPRLFLVPASGELQFGASAPTEIGEALGDDTCLSTASMMTAVDLDGDAIDEVVAVDQTDVCATTGAGVSPAPRLAVGRVGEESSFELTELGAVAGGFRVPYQLEVADLDADGADDLVVTFAGEYLVSDGGLAEGAGVVVLWNTGVGLDTGQTSIALVPAGVEHVVSAVPIDADEDADRELAVLTDAGLFVCELAGREFSEPCRQVEGVAGLRRTKGGGERLRIADVDGDGLDDALVGRRGQIDVYRSVRHFDGEGGS